jgi:hypothetical protein
MKTMIAFLLLSIPIAFGQTLPEAPAPKPLEAHRFMDTQNTIAFSAMTMVRTFDAVQTCHRLGENGHRADGGIYIERSLPTQSCAGVIAFSAAYSSIGIGAAYLLHRTGHYKLERIPMWISFAGAVQGIAYSATKH